MKEYNQYSGLNTNFAITTKLSFFSMCGYNLKICLENNTHGLVGYGENLKISDCFCYYFDSKQNLNLFRMKYL